MLVLVAVTKYQRKCLKYGRFILTQFRGPGSLVSGCGEVRAYDQGDC